MTPHNEPIAIIGSACRFPGESTNPSKLWELLKQPREVSREIDRFQASSFWNKDGHYHGASNVQRSYLLSEDPRLFDTQFFSIPPGEAESIDPQQRLVLETVYEAVDDSGLVLEALRGTNTAVYVGVMCDDYGNICYGDIEAIPTYAATGTARSILSNRVSFVFDWRGPSMTIDTACSSSLVAIHQAVQTLRTGSAPVAVAAGANLIFSPNMFIAESNLNMLSPTGKSQMWDANANGYARGEGMAAIIMKRLSDAIADGDHIECIIRETGVNQDGHTPGITMPSAEAQTRLIHETYARAGLDLTNPKDRPQYFEAHGTGTKAGDGVESKAIYHAFFPEIEKSQSSTAGSYDSLWVGSIKTVIGHTEGTAGLAGVIKACLAINHKTIPPNLHLNKLNPEVAPYWGKLRIAKTAQHWPDLPAGAVRRASINSFGFGGTNAHAILEAYEPKDHAPSPSQTASDVNALPLTFSATSEKSLTALLSKYLAFLTEGPDVDLTQLAWTLHERKSTFAYRSSFTAKTVSELIPQLQKAIDEQGPAVRGSSAQQHLLGVFTGQGAQWATMGRDLISSSKIAESIIDELEHSLNELPMSDRPKWSLKSQLMADPANSRITEGELSQPLCTAVQIVLVELLKLANVHFSAVVGHSSGEIGAAYAAGFLTARDSIRIAYYRGQYAYLAQGSDGQRGGMLAAGTTLDDAKELCELPSLEGRLGVAAYNSSSSVTISGDLDAILEVKEILDDEKVFNRQLKVDTAYHSHHMIPCSTRYRKALEDCHIQIQKPSGMTQWYSSVHGGKLMEPCDALKSTYWVDNMVNIVLFAPALQSALVACKPQPTQVIEVGPHPALKSPASTVIEETIKTSLPYTGTLSRNQNDVHSLAATLGYLWAQFGRSSADWASYIGAFTTTAPKSLRGLPSYPWNHDRVFWYEARKSRVNRLRQDPAHVLLGTRTDTSNEREFRWRNYISSNEIPWLTGHNIQGQTLFPAAGFLVMAVEAARLVGRSQQVRMIELHDAVIHRALAVNEDKGIETLFTLTDVATVSGDSGYLTADFACDACLQKQSENFVSIASGKVILRYGEPQSNALVQYPEEKSLGMLKVEADSFYSCLSSIGYNYTGIFKGITSLERVSNAASGEIYTASQESRADETAGNFLLHPATLDVAFQSIFAAIGYPRDGTLWALHIPTTIRRVILNPAVCPSNGGIDETVRFLAQSQVDQDGGFSGNVDLFAKGDHSLCQVEGLEVTPVSPPTQKDDHPMFMELTHSGATLDAEAFSNTLTLSQKEEGDWAALNDLAVTYLRQLTSSQNSEDSKLQTWAQEILQSAGNTSFIPSSHQIVEAASICKTNLDILEEVGDSIDFSIISSDTASSFMESDLLEKFYASSLGAREARETLGQLLAQIVHRFPHVRVLEIGTGSGSATATMLSRISPLHSTYTCSDTTDEYFEALQKSHSSAILTEVIDLDQDLEAQGIAPASYDVLVAAHGLHRLKNSAKALANMRALLRPGGFLLIQQVTNLEAAHVGLVMGSLASRQEETDSSSRPFSSLEEYDELLTSAGFSGIDTATPESISPFSVIASQAVDQQIKAIRQPLHASAFSIDRILLIGGQKFRVAQLVRNIEKHLRPFCASITVIASIKQLDESVLSARTLVISLTELDEPYFRGLTDQKFKALQALFYRSRNMIWTTQGAKGAEPYANVVKGVVRTLLVEMPHLHCQMFNIEGPLDHQMHGTQLAESLLRLCIADSWLEKTPGYSPLWTKERELLSDHGRLFISRFELEDTLNKYYNSRRRRVVTDVSAADRVVSLNSDGKLDQYRLNPTLGDEAGSAVTIKVEYSLSTAIRIKDLGFLFLSIGTDEKLNTVLALSREHQSILTLPESQVLKVDALQSQRRQILLSIALSLIASSILDQCTATDGIILHEPPSALADFVRDESAKTGAHALFTTTSPQASYKSAWKYIDAFTPARDLKRLVGKRTSVFVDFSASNEHRDLINRFKAELPFGMRQYSVPDLLPSRSALHSKTSGSLVGQLLLEALQQSKSHQMDNSSFSHIRNARIQELADGAKPLEIVTTIDWTDCTPVPAGITAAMNEVKFRSDRTYFMIGMTGSLGLSTCNFMMQRGARFFALCSRNPKIDVRWLKAAEDEYGATIKPVALDITSRADLHRVHRELCATMPPIAGVANAALVMRDGLLMEMTTDKMNLALKSKVEGSLYLDELFCDDKLDFFILYSSIVTNTGNIGQTAYAAGNSFMVSLAHRRRQRGLTGSVMNLGGIAGIGFITETDTSIIDRLDEQGHDMMSETDTMDFFAEAVLAGKPNSGRNPEISMSVRLVNPKQEKNPPKWTNDPKFSHHILDKSQRESGDRAGGAMSIQSQLQEAQTEKDAFNIVLTGLMTMLHKKLDMPAQETVPSDVAIVELGVDSLVAVDIRAWFNTEIEYDVPIIKILGGATLADLVDDAVAGMSAEIAPKLKPNGDDTKEVEQPMEAPKPESAVSASSTQIVDPVILDSSVGTSTAPSEIDVRDSSAVSSDGDNSIESPPALDEPFEKKLASIDTIMSLPEARQDFVKVEKMPPGCARFWFLRKYLEDPNCFNITLQTKLTGQIDVPRFSEAVRKFGARHEVLRTAFYSDEDGELLMGVMPSSPLRLETHEIQDESEAEAAENALENYTFDIERGEVIRMLLLSISEKEHVLIFSIHHIAMDGFSFNLMIHEIDSLYQGKPLGQVTQFTEVAIKQRKDIEAGRMLNDLAWWKDIYVTVPDPLPLFPFANVGARLPLMRYEHEEVELELDAAMAAKVRALCRRNRCTMFHFFLATLKVFLARWLEIEDFSIGIADANRNDVKTFTTIGFLLNLVPLMFRGVNGKAPFAEILDTAKKTAYSALSHSLVPFDMLLEEISLPRASSHSPIFQAFLDYRQMVVSAPPLLDAKVEGQSNFGGTAYDIVLDITDYANANIVIKWQTQKSLYSKAHTQMMLDSYMQLLEFFASNVEAKIDTAPLYRKQDVTEAINAGRGPEFLSEWPDTLSIKVDQVSAQYQDDIALLDGSSNKLTYRDMDRVVDQICEELVLNNVGPGDNVGVFQHPSAMWICSLLAIWRAGAVYVPLDVRNGLPRLAGTVGVVAPAAILCHELTADDVPQLSLPSTARIINVDQVKRANAPATRRANLSTKRSSAMIVSSSGSTGVPKCIEVRHDSLLNLFEGDSKKWQLGRPKALQQSAYSFDISMDQIMTSLVNGGTLYVASQEQRSHPQAIAQILADEDITYTMATPSEYSNWINYATPTLTECHQWRLANIGGEGWNGALRDSFAPLNLPNLELQNCYGPAENTVWCTRLKIPYPQSSSLIPAGRALANYSLYIVDRQSGVVPRGVLGEILIGGAGTAVGYHKNKDLTEAKFLTDRNASSHIVTQGWDTAYRTGDKGYLMEDGTLVVLGRMTGDTQIKLRGFRIELEDIEATLIKASEGSLSRVVANVRGDADARYLVAFAQFSDGFPADERQTHLRKILDSAPLPQYMRPNMLIPLERIPLNSHNKVDRLTIAKLPISDSSTAKVEENLSPREQAVLDLWLEMLPESTTANATLGRDSDFFELGGNSLLTIRLQTTMREKFGLLIPLVQIMESSSLSGLASIIDGLAENGSIDWNQETALSDELLQITPPSGTIQQQKATGRIVVLTGASGFIGRHILQRLIADATVEEVHCIGVRHREADSPTRQKLHDIISTTSKVTMYPGDLEAPRLGLSEADFSTLAQKTDMIIHSGANRSFWNSYRSLKPANVLSTKEIAMFAAVSLRDHNRSVPIHYLSGSNVIKNEPPTDNSMGYVASKWASEQFLEKFAQNLGVPVHIHRQLPVADDKATTGAELDSVIQEFLDAASRMDELPDSASWGGHYDLISASELAADIVDRSGSPHDRLVSHHSHFSSVRMDIAEINEKLASIAEFAESEKPRIPGTVWVGKAKLVGFKYQFSSMNMFLQNGKGTSFGELQR